MVKTDSVLALVRVYSCACPSVYPIDCLVEIPLMLYDTVVAPVIVIVHTKPKESHHALFPLYLAHTSTPTPRVRAP